MGAGDERLFDQPGIPADGQLLDCGHVGAFAGICQHDNCADRLCPDCTATCESCGVVLCIGHQVRLSGRQRVFCRPDARRYVAKQVTLRLFGRDRDA